MKNDTITIGDRIAAVGVMAIASFLTGLFLWGFSLFVTMAGSFKTLLSFYYVFYFMVPFIVAALFSPLLAINAIGKLWKWLENLFGRANDSPW